MSGYLQPNSMVRNGNGVSLLFGVEWAKQASYNSLQHAEMLQAIICGVFVVRHCWRGQRKYIFGQNDKGREYGSWSWPR
jgi:hypothetical protein